MRAFFKSCFAVIVYLCVDAADVVWMRPCDLLNVCHGVQLVLEVSRRMCATLHRRFGSLSFAHVSCVVSISLCVYSLYSLYSLCLCLSVCLSLSVTLFAPLPLSLTARSFLQHPSRLQPIDVQEPGKLVQGLCPAQEGRGPAACGGGGSRCCGGEGGERWEGRWWYEQWPALF